MSPPGPSVSVEFVRSAREIDAALWEACFPGSIEGRFWYETLERSALEEQFLIRYGLISLEGRTVGIAPCFVHDVPLWLVAPEAAAAALKLLDRLKAGLARQRTFFVGSPCADAGTVGLVPGVRLAEVLGGLAEEVRRQAQRDGAALTVFKDFEERDLPDLLDLCRAQRMFPMLSYPGTVADLPPGGKQAYLASLSGQRRHQLLKKLRRSRESIELETTVARAPDSRLLDEILGLFLQTYLKGRTKFERLGRPFFDAVREAPQARFILLRDRSDGKLAAFMLVFDLDGRVINKFIGLDYEKAGRTFLYFRLFDAAVDYACERGARQLQSGQTGYRAKLDLGHRLVPLYNVAWHRNGLVRALYRRLGASVTWPELDPDLATYLEAHPQAQPQLPLARLSASSKSSTPRSIS